MGANWTLERVLRHNSRVWRAEHFTPIEPLERAAPEPEPEPVIEVVPVVEPAAILRVPGATLEVGHFLHETDLRCFRTGGCKRQHERVGSLLYVIHAGGRYYAVTRAQYSNPQGRITCTLWYQVLSLHAGYKVALTEAQRIAEAAKPAPLAEVMAQPTAPRLELEAAIAADGGPYAIGWDGEAWGKPWQDCGGRVLLLATPLLTDHAATTGAALKVAAETVKRLDGWELDCHIGWGGELIINGQNGTRRCRYEFPCNLHGPALAAIEPRAILALGMYPGCASQPKGRELMHCGKFNTGGLDRICGAPVRVVLEAGGAIRLDGLQAKHVYDKRALRNTEYEWRAKGYLRGKQYIMADAPLTAAGATLADVPAAKLAYALSLLAEVAGKPCEHWEFSKHGYLGHIRWQVGEGRLRLMCSDSHHMAFSDFVHDADDLEAAGMVGAADVGRAVTLLAKVEGAVRIARAGEHGLALSWGGGSVTLGGVEVNCPKSLAVLSDDLYHGRCISAPIYADVKTLREALRKIKAVMGWDAYTPSTVMFRLTNDGRLIVAGENATGKTGETISQWQNAAECAEFKHWERQMDGASLLKMVSKMDGGVRVAFWDLGETGKTGLALIQDGVTVGRLGLDQ